MKAEVLCEKLLRLHGTPCLVIIDGERVDFFVIVEEDIKGLLHYDIQIDPEKTKATLDSSSAASVGVSLSQIPNLGFSPESSLDDAGVNVKSDGYVFDATSEALVLNLFIEIRDEKGNWVLLPDDEAVEKTEEELPSVETGQDGGKTGSMHTGPMPIVRSVGAEGARTIPNPSEPSTQTL